MVHNRYATTAINEVSPGAPLLFQDGLLQAIEKTAELGFEAIEIHVVDPVTFPVQLVAKACAEHQLSVAAIATGRVFTKRHRCITSPDLTNREAAMEELFSYIDIAANLDSKDGVIIGWVKGNRTEETDGFDDLLAAQFRRLADYATSKEQKLLIEVINRYETNTFNTCAELVSFLDRFEIPNTYIHLDTFHMNIDEANPAAAIRLAGDRLGYIHFADSNRHAPGGGHFDFAPVLKALTEVGYQGSFSLECFPIPDGETAAVNGKTFLTSIDEY